MNDENKINNEEKEKLKNRKKTLLIKKINVNKNENKQILRIINKSFNDVNSYLSSNVDGKNIIIGKKIIPLKNQSFQIIKDSLNDKKHLSKNILFFLKSRNTFYVSNNNNHDKNNLNKVINPYNNKKFKSYTKMISTPIINQYPISKSELNKIYEYFKQIKIRNDLDNKRKYNSSRNSPSNFHINFSNKENLSERSLYNSLKLQEKILNLNKKYSKEKKKIEKRLFTKTQKKKEDLLLNQIDLYRPFKETQDKDNDNIFTGNLNWLMNLRVNDNFIKDKNKNLKNAFINIGCLSRPNYKMIYKADKIKEKIRSNFVNFNNSLFSKNQRYIKNSLKEAYNELNDLAIEGKNLLKCEIENSNLIKGKKILYKERNFENEINNKEIFKSFSVREFKRNLIIDNCFKLHNDIN